MRSLITGITGFVGSHMAKHALAQAASFVASHRFLVFGTSEEYGLVHPEEIPGGETDQLRPLSPSADAGHLRRRSHLLERTLPDLPEFWRHRVASAPH